MESALYNSFSLKSSCKKRIKWFILNNIFLDNPNIISCKNCSNEFEGKYCNICGEKVLDSNERTIRYLFGQVINGFTFVDNKFLKSFWYFFFKPGFLANEFVNGVRKKYSSPLSFFFVANLIYFLYVPFDGLNSTLWSQMNFQYYSGVVTNLVNEKVENNNLELSQYTIEYNQQSTKIAKLTLILLVPIFSVFVLMINFHHKRLYVDHLVYTLYFISVVIFIMMLTSLLFYLMDSFTSFKLFGKSEFLSIIFQITLLIPYLYLAQNTFYGGHKWINLTKGFLTIIFLIPTFTIYRMLLFILTYLSIG